MTSERNGPCPCGSGKKYKHCCLNRVQNPFQFAVADIKPQEGAVEKAMDWLATRHRKGWQVAFELLYEELLSLPDRNKLSRLDQETISGIQINLTEWLLAEGDIQAQGSKRRISDYLIGPSGPTWTAGQRDWLQQLGQRPLRLYTVTEVVPGVQITLCDTLNGDATPMVVRERSGSQSLAPGMYFGARVVRVGEHFELSGAGYPFSMLSGPMVADRLRATAEEFGDLPGLAQEQGLVLMSLWLQQYVAPPAMPTLIDHYSGEPMTLITDHYRVLDWDTLARALQGCPDVEGDRQDGWSRFIDCADGQIRHLAHINLGKKENQLEVFYKTQSYADQGRAWLDALAGAALVFLVRKVISPEAAMAQSSKRGTRSPKAASFLDIDPHELAQAMADVVRRSYANWADEPIPALNNKTPRQAIQTAAGLERVKGLLRSYEDGEKTQANQQGRVEVSYDFLWESLGLSR